MEIDTLVPARDYFLSGSRAVSRHMLTILFFALVLGLTVQWVRFSLLRREHRDSMAERIHADHLKTEEKAS